MSDWYIAKVVTTKKNGCIVLHMQIQYMFDTKKNNNDVLSSAEILSVHSIINISIFIVIGCWMSLLNLFEDGNDIVVIICLSILYQKPSSVVDQIEKMEVTSLDMADLLLSNIAFAAFFPLILAPFTVPYQKPSAASPANQTLLTGL